MLRKLVEAQVNPDNPWADDVLERRQIAEHLTRILETVNDPIVASVSAPFGMGKTFFAKRWVANLRLQEKIAVYMNAWESDYAQNPLLAFMSSLREQLKEHKLEKNKRAAVARRIQAVSKVAGPALAKTVARAALRASAYVLVGDKVDDLVEAAVKGAVDEAEKFAEAQIEAFTKERESRAKFRKELALLRSEVTTGNIYVVVDELDRCRPPYALEFLEAIKHLFDVPGFVFVLVVDDEQLLASAAALFGARIEGEDYLRKFIDYRFRLPIPSYEACARYLYQAYAIGEVLRQDENTTIWGRSGLTEGFAYFASKLGLSLRAQIQAYSTVNLVLRTYGRTYMPVLAALVCLRESRPQLWKEFISKRASCDDVASALGFDPKMTREVDDDYWYLHHVLRVFFVEKPLRKEGDDLSEVDRYAVDLWEHLRLHFGQDRLRFEKVDLLLKKIELVEQFSN